MSEYWDGYAAETDEGPTWVRPFETALANAVRLVPRDRWQTCPVCGLACPLFYGDPDGDHFCALCAFSRHFGLERE